MNSRLRIAVIGCGAICDNHITAILNKGYLICALCDIDPQKAEAKIQKHQLKNATVYTDYNELLEAEAPDAVHICTPHFLHAPMAIAALKRNVHVLCEKPIAITEQQLQELELAVKNSQAQLGVCHQNRYEPNMRSLKNLAEGKVEAGFGSVVWHRDQAYYNSAQWRGTWEQEGGGVMINQALHTLDLLQWICGFPKYVVASTHNALLQGVIEVEDTAFGCFECENGARFNFFATNTSTKDLPIQIQIRLNNGDIIDAQNEHFCFNHTLLDSEKNINIVGKRVWGGGHKDLISDFYDHVMRNEPFPLGLGEAAKVIRMILAMYASNGTRVEISDL